MSKRSSGRSRSQGVTSDSPMLVTIGTGGNEVDSVTSPYSVCSDEFMIAAVRK